VQFQTERERGYIDKVQSDPKLDIMRFKMCVASFLMTSKRQDGETSEVCVVVGWWWWSRRATADGEKKAEWFVAGEISISQIPLQIPVLGANYQTAKESSGIEA